MEMLDNKWKSNEIAELSSIGRKTTSQKIGTGRHLQENKRERKKKGGHFVFVLLSTSGTPTGRLDMKSKHRQQLSSPPFFMYTNIFDELLLAATQAALFVLSVGYLSKRIDSISNRVSPLGSFLSWLTLHVWASWQIASIKPSPAQKKENLTIHPNQISIVIGSVTIWETKKKNSI